MSAHNFQPNLPVLTKVSNYKIKKLNLRHYRVRAIPLTPSPSKGTYLLPKKQCLKYTKKFTYETTAESSKNQAKKVISLVRSARPTSLTVSCNGLYRISDKLDLLGWLNNTSNLQHLTIAIEGGLIELDVSQIFTLMLYRSPRLHSLAFDTKRCTIKQSAEIAEGILIQKDLQELTYNLASSDTSDQEIVVFCERMSQLKHFQKLKSFILSEKANRRITDQGASCLASLLQSFQNLETLKLDIVGTSITTKGLAELLDSLSHQSSLETFFLHAGEVSEISSVLSSFFKAQQNLRDLCIDLSHDSKLDQETLQIIQDGVAQLPKLEKYQLNVEGCHNLEESGTFYLPESLRRLQSSVKNLTVNFASFLEDSDKGHIALDSLRESLSGLNQLESLSLDFSSCSDWFMDTDRSIQERFFRSLPVMSNLKSLSLNLKKSQISPQTLQGMLETLHELEILKAFEIDLSFCKSIKEKDLRGILLHLCGSLKLKKLQIYADDINYDENKLSTDIHLAVESSQTLRELYISLKKTLMGRQASLMVAKFEPKHPHFFLTIKGGQAFTLVRPGSRNVHKPAIRSIFGK